MTHRRRHQCSSKSKANHIIREVFRFREHCLNNDDSEALQELRDNINSIFDMSDDKVNFSQDYYDYDWDYNWDTDKIDYDFFSSSDCVRATA